MGGKQYCVRLISSLDFSLIKEIQDLHQNKTKIAERYEA